MSRMDLLNWDGKRPLYLQLVQKKYFHLSLWWMKLVLLLYPRFLLTFGKNKYNNTIFYETHSFGFNHKRNFKNLKILFFSQSMQDKPVQELPNFVRNCHFRPQWGKFCGPDEDKRGLVLKLVASMLLLWPLISIRRFGEVKYNKSCTLLSTNAKSLEHFTCSKAPLPE